MIGRALVGTAFFLQGSPRYRRVKIFFRDLLENPDSLYKRLIDYVMMVLIAISIYILVRHVKHDISPELLFFNNIVISVIFLIEYLLRLWVFSDGSKFIIEQYEHDLFLQRPFQWGRALRRIVANKTEFILSPSAIVDLFAIMPFFHELRMLRIFILFRIIKLFRYTKSLMQFVSILASKKFEIATLGLFASVIIAISSVLIYIMEANNPDSPINTLFEALYWSVVTIFTVGYGDLVPVTQAGRWVAMAIIIAGIAVISFATSIVVSAFTEKLDVIKEEKLIDDVSKMGRFYLICGYTALSEQIARHFIRKGMKILILDNDPLKVSEAQRAGFMALSYDPSSINSYQMLRIDLDKQVIAALLVQQSDVLNVYTALTIRGLSACVLLISILVHRENRRKLSRAGINEIVYTPELIGLMSREMSGSPVAFEVIHALRSENSVVFIEEVALDAQGAERLLGVSRCTTFHKRLILMGLYKPQNGDFDFNPGPQSLAEAGDVAIVIGSRALIDEFKAALYQKGRR